MWSNIVLQINFMITSHKNWGIQGNSAKSHKQSDVKFWLNWRKYWVVSYLSYLLVTWLYKCTYSNLETLPKLDFQSRNPYLYPRFYGQCNLKFASQNSNSKQSHFKVSNIAELLTLFAWNGHFMHIGRCYATAALLMF